MRAEQPLSSRLSNRFARAALVFVAACDAGAPPTGQLPVSSAIAPSSGDVGPKPPPSVACGTAGDRWCATAGSSATCLADGSTREAACAATEACLGGTCSTLVDPDGAPTDAAAVRTFSEDGFVNAWSGVVGIGPKAGSLALEGMTLEPLGGPRAMRAICSGDGYVVPIRAADTKADDRSVAVLAGVLYSDGAREIAVRAGTTGKLTLKIGSLTLAFEELPGREGRAWPDERTLRVNVPKGASDVLALVEPRSAAFHLRFRDVDGSRPRGLAWRERVGTAACSPSALVDPRADVALRSDGVHFVAAPRFAGVVPRTLPTELSLATLSGGKVASTRTAKLDPLTIATQRGSVIDAPVELPERGAFELRAELGDDAVFTRRWPAAASALARRGVELTKVLDQAKAAQIDSGSRASFERQVDLVTSAVARAEPDTAWVARNADVAEQLATELAKGVDPYLGRKGVVMRAYRSTLDDRLQPYVVFVPRSYDPKKKSPVVLVAHGRDRLPEHALRTLIGEAPDEHMTLSFAAHNLPPMPDLGAILVAPYGYGNGSVLALGEVDVRAVLDDLGRAYALDDRRIGLTGYSLGGTVAFLYPLHSPGVFSAAAPLCGYPNLMGYQSVANVEKQPWEEALLRRKYVVEYAENGQYVPMKVVHGGKDVPGRSKVVVDRYRDLGYSVIFDVPEEADHNVWDDAYEDGRMIPWLTAKRAPAAPASVKLVTRDYRYDRAFWVRVVRMQSSTGSERTEIDARWLAKDNAITLEAKNVEVVALDLDRLEPRPSGPVTIRMGGASAEAMASGVAFVARAADGSITVGGEAPAAPRLKAHDLSGGLDDVLFHPVTVVVGTSDPRLTEANRVLADHLSRLGGLADVRYPILDDVDATDGALGARSVVLVGGPASNLLTRALTDAHAIPLEMTTDRVAVGATSATAPDLGVALVFPRPEAFRGEGVARSLRDRYVTVYAGLTPEATLAARVLPRYLPDWVIFDASLATRRGGLLMEDRKVRGAGFFSERWD